jgi:LmbE family N-acetylglucosaminyl deacetylase/GT2 family glycosyltransferase
LDSSPNDPPERAALTAAPAAWKDFPPLLDPQTLPRRVLVLAPHPDDEVLGCGGMLAFHAARGDEVRLVFLTGGGSPREEEAARAARSLGLDAPRVHGFADGELAAEEELASCIAREIAEFDPELVYAPSPLEHHPDHRATLRALVDAAASADFRCLLYGVNQPAPRGVLFDITRWREQKREALEAHASQSLATGLVDKAEALGRAATINVDDPAVEACEAFSDVGARELASFARRADQLAPVVDDGRPAATAVISSWNKIESVRRNLEGLFRQTRPFARVVVVDNASTDGTAEMIRAEFPAVHLVEMPHSNYGACETFNVGFAQAETPWIAILDDDVVLPPGWLEGATARLLEEPPTTAILSSKVVEPGMPQSYRDSVAVNTERYMSTFRGCASLARREALAEVGYYDERLFIYGNERDLTCRLLNAGYRVLQYPGVEVFHETPFGIKQGQRSLYYHARNAGLTMLKYAPLGALLKLPWLVLKGVVLRPRATEDAGEITDATGTIGIGRSLRETPGAWWVMCKALASIVWNLPYCLRRRRPVRHSDFELPLE